jgi:hypothetical protein
MLCIVILLHVSSLVPGLLVGREYRKYKTTFPVAPERLPTPGCPPRHPPPPSPRAGRLAVCPASRTPVAGRLTRRSCLGLGDRPPPAARRSETLPRWARGSEEDRKCKRPFGATSPAATPCPQHLRRPQHTAAERPGSPARRDFGWDWTCVLGTGRVTPQGCLRGRPREGRGAAPEEIRVFSLPGGVERFCEISSDISTAMYQTSPTCRNASRYTWPRGSK